MHRCGWSSFSLNWRETFCEPSWPAHALKMPLLWRSSLDPRESRLVHHREILYKKPPSSSTIDTREETMMTTTTTIYYFRGEEETKAASKAIRRTGGRTRVGRPSSAAGMLEWNKEWMRARPPFLARTRTHRRRAARVRARRAVLALHLARYNYPSNLPAIMMMH